MLQKKIRFILLSGLACGSGMSVPFSALASCSPAIASGASITCDGAMTTQLDFTELYEINVTMAARSQLALTEANTPAIYYQASKSSLTNQGTITTEGIGSDGILFQGTEDSELTNAAAIRTSGSNANAIHLNELFDSTITNNGELSTTGNLGSGIYIDGGARGNRIINNGNILTTGSDAHGISAADSQGTTINNNSVISAVGPFSDGMHFNDAKNIVVINGAKAVVNSQTHDGINFGGSSTGSIENNGAIEGGNAGIALQGNAQVASIVNNGIIAGGKGGITFDDSSGTNLLLNAGIIGSIEGDAIRVSSTSNVTNGINNEGIIIGRVNAPSTNMSNSDIFDLLNNNAPSRVNNYSQSSDAFLALQADNSTNYGQLQVAGTATLNGTTLVVTRGSTGFQNGDVLSGVVTAANIVGTPSSVLDDSLRYQFVQEQTPTSYSLRVVDTNMTTVRSAVGTQTASTSLSTLGGAIDRIIINTNNSGKAAGNGDKSGSGYCSGALGSTVCAITSSLNEQQVYKNVVQLGPLMNGMMPYVELNNLRSFGDIVDSRQDALRNFGKTNEFNPEKYLWIRPVGSWDNQQKRDGLDGYKSGTRGIAIGADVPVNEQARVGLALGVSRTDVNDTSSDLRHDAQVESWNTLVYGGFDFTPETALTWQAGYGRNKTEGNRYLEIVNPSDSTVAYSGVGHSNYDSHTLQAGLGLQSTFALAEKWTLTPLLRTDYYRIKDKGYRESGADDVGLYVNGQTLEAMIVSTKAKVGLQLSDNVNIHASAGVGYDTMNDRSEIHMAFIGSPETPVTFHSMKPSPWIGMAGVGVTAKFTSVIDGTVQYDAQQRSDYTSQSVSLKLRYIF